ncbi:MAG: hypothetical protein CBC05_01925 [Crocinitomicaceae bacterium TMED45]|nr:MAG: hypothetical protein CBC05_01925 [Crocinitomicaceae bacterium TMED45]
MQNAITIKKGFFEDQPIQDVTFKMIKDYHPYKQGGGFYLVDGRSADEGESPAKPIRVKVSDPSDAESVSSVAKKKVKSTETDDQAMERIKERFEILTQMTEATQEGSVRAMIVSGPPGVGKSFGVEEQLNKSDIFNKMADVPPKFEVVRGSMSALGLYQKLYKFSSPGNILVLDDCDSVLFDDISLNILKAALDSSKKRYISWNTESRVLANEGVPDRFEYKGSVIMITNIKFDYVKSKKLKDHLNAIMSRCHYLDLTMDTVRDRLLRCKQVMRDANVLGDYGFSKEQGDEIVDFMVENQDHLNEISLRMVTKIADLRKMSDDWMKLARVTCMKQGSRPAYAGTGMGY